MTKSQMDHSHIDTDSLICETRRLCQRYIDEIILPYSLCPWAAPALSNGSVQISVITGHFAAPADIGRASTAARQVLDACTEEAIELVLIVLPQSTFSRLEMDDLLRHLRQARAHIEDQQGELAFALAAFHPEALPDTTTAERFIPYLRRSPDPMIQAVRSTVLRKIDPSRGAGTAYFDVKNMSLESLASPTPEPLRTRIAKTNLASCRQAGLDEMEKRYAAIMTDRRTTWERLRGRNV